MTKEKLCRWCGKPIEREPNQSNASYTSTHLHRGECSHNRKKQTGRKYWHKKVGVKPPPKFLSKVQMDEYVPCRDVEREVGVGPGVISVWLKARGRRRFPLFFRYLGRSYVRLDVANEYLEDHPPIPKHYVPFKRLQLDIGKHSWNTLMRLQRLGRIKPLRRKGSGGIFLSPDDAALVRQETLGAYAIPGWVSTRDISQRAGVSRSAIGHWLRDRPEIERRIYNHGTGKCTYVRHQVAEFYINEVGKHRNSRRKQTVLQQAA